MDELSLFLKSEYGIVSNSIFPTKGGFSTKTAYHVVDADGAEYFVKIYDKSLSTTRFFVERIDAYMPALAWLSTTQLLHGRILTPVSSRKGAYSAEMGNDICVLFLYVGGKVPGVQGMTRAQTAELAEILAFLHNVGKTIPFGTPGLAENISLPFCEQLSQYICRFDEKHATLYNLITTHYDLLLSAIDETIHLRDTVRLDYTPLVLCHGDAHGNNVIQNNRLVLVDWEDLRWAPAEADLFIHAWHPYGDTLLEAYTAARPGYHLNRELLYFYILRRRIEDVWVDIQRLIEESPNEVETTKLLEWIQRGIGEVRAIYRDKR